MGSRPQPCRLEPPADTPAVGVRGGAELAAALTWGLLPGLLAQLVWREGVG